jgi:dTDP-4-dehydrorhamnose reductase
MNILLTGAAGQLGSELLPLLSRRGRVIATDRSTPPGAGDSWLEQDIVEPGILEAMLDRLRPDLIVNTAAYTAVDQAESEPQTAFEVNATLPGRLAGWARRNDARVLHYSTDYVFDGIAQTPYRETDPVSPRSVYGESKLAGEAALASAGCGHIILRTSWVYSSHGKNFVLSMLELAKRGIELNIVDDQEGCPTWARNLAGVSDKVIAAWCEPGSQIRDGLYHYCDDEALSWYDFARAIFSLAEAEGLLEATPPMTPVPSADFQQAAVRPNFSVLDTHRIQAAFGLKPRPFRQALQQVIAEIANTGKPREPSVKNPV